MKDNKGITLISLIVYIIGMIAIMSIISLVISFYTKNLERINDTSDINAEFNKFDTSMIQETKTLGNAVKEITGNSITFTNGNKYIFQDGKIYQNTIVICKYVKEFSVNLETDGNKQMLRIYILLERGKIEIVKNLSYALEKLETEVVGNHIFVVQGEKETPEVDASGLAKENVTIKPDANSNVQIVIPTGFAPAILKGSNSTYSNPGQDGSVKEIMKPEDWNKITIEQINQGIVIVDHAITYDGGNSTGTVPDFNEYVWVPIPESSNFARTKWNGPYYDTEYHLTGTHPLAEESTTNKYWDNKTTAEYTNMVDSVEHYKGFYIGRYEASQGSGNIAQSKRNILPWISVAQTTAKTACANNSTENMHLMYGIEWDSALNWLIGNAQISSSTSGQTKTMEIADLQTNSCSWGNYNNSTGDAATNSGGNNHQTTGYSEYWKANNIYDLAGNIFEWTQENYSTGTNRALRGGHCYDVGDIFPVAYRLSFGEGDTVGSLRVPWQLFCSTGLW